MATLFLSDLKNPPVAFDFLCTLWVEDDFMFT